MKKESKNERAAAAMRRINQTWLAGHVDDLAEMVHPEIVMAFPGFAGRSEGRDAFLAGFRDFCENAVVHEFDEYEYQVDVAGDTAVVTYRYAMIYEREGRKNEATGRDLWIFQWQRGEWLAVWRTMLELEEKPA